MQINMNELSDWLSDARRELAREREQMIEKIERLDGLQKMTEVTDELLSEIETLKDDNTSLREQLNEEKRLRAEQEMKMAEMSKLSAGMAKKTSQDDLNKALRTYANRSKRKTPDKRAFAKTAILEIANANGLALPEDLAATIDSLDDEQEAKPAEIHNHFEAGSSAQVFNEKVSGTI